MAVKKKVKLTSREKITVTISVILIIISVLAVSFVFLWNWKPFDNQKGGVFTPPVSNETDVKNEIGQRYVNFLIVGLDESELLSDVILVICVDIQKKSAEILQIPRDSYVTTQTSTGKINSIYNHGDQSLQPVQRLIKIIYEQFKLQIDYYGVITLDSFRNIVDAIGGVPVNMPQKLVYDPSKIIPAGEQILNGEQAEWLVRHRSSYVEGDIGRIKAQRLFLASFVQKIKELGLMQFTTKIIPKIYDQISSNMAIKDVVKYADSFFDIEMENIRIHMIPGEGYMYKGQAVWAIHADETAQLLNNYFRPYSSDIPVEKLGIIRLTYTGDWYENTDDNFSDIIDGKTPGQKTNNSESSNN